MKSRPDPRDADLERRWRAIEAKLDAASESLARQGSVAARSTPAGVTVFSVRYVAEEGGRRRQKAVYLGASPALAERARALIRRYRRAGALGTGDGGRGTLRDRQRRADAPPARRPRVARRGVVTAIGAAVMARERRAAVEQGFGPSGEKVVTLVVASSSSSGTSTAPRRHR